LICTEFIFSMMYQGQNGYNIDYAWLLMLGEGQLMLKLIPE